MDDRERPAGENDRARAARENTLVDAIADDCAAARARIAAEEARIARRLAEAWGIAQEQTARITSARSALRDLPLRCIASQIALEVHVNDRTLQTKMHQAWQLVERFPATTSALEAGQISKGHADAIVDLGSVLDEPEVRAAYEAVVLEWANSETVGRTRAYARQLAEQLNPRPMQDRHADAADERSITVVDLDDGMSEIIARVPTALAHGIRDRLTRQAKGVKHIALGEHAPGAGGGRADEARTTDESPGDGNTDVRSTGMGSTGVRNTSAGNTDAGSTGDRKTGAGKTGAGNTGAGRTLDQIRADIFTDILLTGAPTIDPTIDEMPGGLGAIRAHVQVTMPITTLTGVTAGGAEIDGCAPIDPATARTLAGNTPIWDRLLYDPVTAVPVVVDRRRQTPAQERFLRARDKHCRMPGCRMPARPCQIDHNHEHHEGGPTSLCNLACLCVRHHTMKTETEWTVRQLDGGRLEWSSPSGRTYCDKVPPVVGFVPDGPPAPF